MAKKSENKEAESTNGSVKDIAADKVEVKPKPTKKTESKKEANEPKDAKD